MSNGIENMVTLNYPLVICLAIAWLLMFLSISRGVKGLGKVAYFTAIFPYIMITILLGRGASLDGALDGIKYYVTPEWEKLANIKVWSQAASQIFFSLSICMGGVITLSSYNPFKNNFLRDSLTIAVCNSLTRFAIFSVIGFMAKDLNKNIDEVADQGVGLAFIVYPSALSMLPVAPLWSCLFFLMILILGFGSEMTLIEAIVMTIVDQWPHKLRHRKVWVLACVCVVMFLAGLFMCTSAGIYILQLMDSYCVPYSALFIAFFEVMTIAWVFGMNKYLERMKEMLGSYPFPKQYWKYMYQYFCPIVIAVLLILQFVYKLPTTYGNYEYPVYSEVIGWLLCVSSIIFIPGIALYQILYKMFAEKLSFKLAVKTLIEPTSVWSKSVESNGFSNGHEKSDQNR
ncbi:unnamed protein product, partial [Medioppia subpectinata]